MRSKILNFTFLLLFSAFILISCKKDEDNLDKDTSVATDHNEVSSESSMILDMFDKAADEKSVNKTAVSFFPACATITLDTSANFRTLIITFGDSTGNACPCTLWDGKYRKGTIISTWTGRYRDSNAIHTLNSVNYFVGQTPTNLNQHKIHKTVTNKGRNSSNNIYFEIVENDTVLINNNGGEITWTSTRNREWIGGESTVLNPFDDKYSITGTSTGKSRTGKTYQMVTTTPIILDFSCRWRIIQGTITVTPQGMSPRIINYGNGACDSTVEVTINGRNYTISI